MAFIELGLIIEMSLCMQNTDNNTQNTEWQIIETVLYYNISGANNKKDRTQQITENVSERESIIKKQLITAVANAEN